MVRKLQVVWETVSLPWDAKQQVTAASLWLCLWVAVEMGDTVKCPPHTSRGEITLSFLPCSLCLPVAPSPAEASNADADIAQRLSPAVSSMR